MTKRKPLEDGGRLKVLHRLNEAELLRIVASESRYHLYEVQDVIREYHRQMQIQLLKGYEVYIPGLWAARLVYKASRWYYSRQKGHFEWSRPGIKMKITPSRSFTVNIAEYFGFEPRKGPHSHATSSTVRRPRQCRYPRGIGGMADDDRSRRLFRQGWPQG